MLGQPTLDSWNHDSRWEGDRLILTASGLGPDEDLIITARFSPNSLTQSAPQWRARQERSKAATARAPGRLARHADPDLSAGLDFHLHPRQLLS
ncbi:MAG: hypothetical protein MZU84_06920 [Sphingobacterium sp.]|nr:hypothetical protein [Sphingobacterium sp.]